MVVVVLGSTQALAWASSFYLPAVLADPIARDLGMSPAWIFAGLSLGLGISGFLGPSAGRLIDESGGRQVLCASNLLFALGLGVLAATSGGAAFFFAWCILGVAMAAGLYEPAFAALTRLYGRNSHTPITGITLIAGFASTVGWPTTAYMEHRFGWRGACLGWAVLHLCLGLPLNAWALRTSPPQPTSAPEELSSASRTGLRARADRRMVILSFMFTASGIVAYGVAANLPGLFAALGATPRRRYRGRLLDGSGTGWRAHPGIRCTTLEQSVDQRQGRECPSSARSNCARRRRHTHDRRLFDRSRSG